MAETAQEQHQRRVAEVRLRGFVRSYDRTDWLLALFLSLTTWTLLTLFAPPVLHPEFWSGVAVAAGARPPDSAASGLGLALARAIIDEGGVTRGVSMLTGLGHAVGALLVGLCFLLMRSAFSARLSLKSEELLVLSPCLRALAVVGAVAFACSEALWIRLQFLSDELICLLLGAVVFVAFDRFRRHRHFGWQCLCNLALGLLAAETPVGMALAVGIHLWNRWERKLYWEAFADEEHIEEIRRMAFRRERWLAAFVFLTGFVAALVVGGRAFCDLGGLAAAERTAWGYPLELIASWYRQTRPLLQPASLFFTAVFSLFPFCIALACLPTATDAKKPFRAGAALLILLVGGIAWTQLSPFADCWCWTWNLGDFVPPVASLRSFMAFFGAAALTAALQVACCACRRQVPDARKISVEEEASFARVRRFCQCLLAVVAVLIVGLSVAGRRQVDVCRKLAVVDEYVKTLADQARGLGWLFTDGTFDDALSIELLARGEEEPRLLSMMSGRSDYAAHLRTLAARDDEDRRVLGIGSLETLRFWAAERRDRLVRTGLQLGFEVLVKCRVTDARSAGLLLRIGTPADADAFDRADADARKLCDRALAVAGATGFGGRDQEVADKFDFILWRLARLSEFRMAQFMRQEDGPSAARERERVKRLDNANQPYLALKSKLERREKDGYLVLSPQEGLAVALKRGDFNLARPYANRMLRLDPTDLNANFAIGMWAIENRLYGVALKYLETAREKRPDEPSILNNLAMVRFKLGDLAEAREVIERAAKANPASKEIQQNLRRIRAAVETGTETSVASKKDDAPTQQRVGGATSRAKAAERPRRAALSKEAQVRIVCAALVVLGIVALAFGWAAVKPYLAKAVAPLKRAYDEWAVRGVLKKRAKRRAEAEKAEAVDRPEPAPSSPAAASVLADVPKNPLPPPREEPVAPVVAPPPPVPDSKGLDETFAERFWNEAREMPHNFIPDPQQDRGYLNRLCRAAELGHVLALEKLGDYAYRRGMVVEAYYWTLLACLYGKTDVSATLLKMRKQWLQEGCPPEYENEWEGFSEQQGVFARAVLRLRCGLEAALARRRLAELVDAGCREAVLFSEKGEGIG